MAPPVVAFADRRWCCNHLFDDSGHVMHTLPPLPHHPRPQHCQSPYLSFPVFSFSSHPLLPVSSTLCFLSLALQQSPTNSAYIRAEIRFWFSVSAALFLFSFPSPPLRMLCLLLTFYPSTKSSSLSYLLFQNALISQINKLYTQPTFHAHSTNKPAALRHCSLDLINISLAVSCACTRNLVS